MRGRAFYALNGSRVHWAGAVEMHFMDPRLGTSKVELHYAFNNSIAMIMPVHVEADLMGLPT